MDLDPRTVFIVGAGFLFVTTLTLTILVPTLPQDTRRSAHLGVLATATLAVSWLLIALQGLVPEPLSLVGGNLLYLIAVALVYQSIRLLDGEKMSWQVNLGVVAPAIVATIGARYLVDAYAVRVFVMSVAVALLLALASRRLFAAPRGRRPNPGRRAAAYWLATTSALLSARAVGTAVLGAAPQLFDAGPTADTLVAISVVVALGAVFAYFLVFSGRLTAELAVQAHLDPLTELLNRRGFEERAELELKRAERSGKPVSLLMIDANDFKQINDTWGHFAGDRALLALANGIRERVRPYDLVGRLGGDEFAVLLPGLDSQAAAELVPRLLESIAEQPTDHGGHLAVSIGRSTLQPASRVDQSGAAISTPTVTTSGDIGAGELLRRLLAAADDELYDLKRTRF